ncbi:hypothetical protein TMatcc_001043 [Talaromyces marneffei ATCC 18224]
MILKPSAHCGISETSHKAEKNLKSSVRIKGDIRHAGVTTETPDVMYPTCIQSSTALVEILGTRHTKKNTFAYKKIPTKFLSGRQKKRRKALFKIVQCSVQGSIG